MLGGINNYFHGFLPFFDVENIVLLLVTLIIYRYIIYSKCIFITCLLRCYFVLRCGLQFTLSEVAG
jgi:hypothetical protein